MTQASPEISARQAGVLAAAVGKTYGTRRALRGVDFTVGPGEVHALLGANGAGKSTMLKIMTGAVEPDAGSQISINGQALYPGRGFGVRTAQELGLRVLHQEAPLLETLTVAENIGLSHGFRPRNGIISWARLNEYTRELLADYEIDVAPNIRVGRLTGAVRASLGLAMTLGQTGAGPRTLILDEATAMLSTTDGDRFLERVRHAADQGASVVFVTHRLHEVEMIADQVTVLRDGDVVHTGPVAEIHPRELVKQIVGTEQVHVAPRRLTQTAVTEEPSLVVEDLVADGVAGVKFQVRPGEIVGLSGRTSSGAAALAAIIGGAAPWKSGQMRQFGRIVKPGSRQAIERGCAYLPADRLRLSGDPSLSLADNMVLPRTRRYWGRKHLEQQEVHSSLDRLSVQPADPWRPLGVLSGGNQQRVLLAKWLLTDPRLIVLDEPTFGVDVRAAEIINRQITELAASGATVVVASGDADQLLALCTRVLVMIDGAIVDELTDERINREELNLAIQ